MTTNQVAGMSEAETAAQVRWHDWQVRGAADGRVTATRMRSFALCLAAALVGWMAVHLF